MPFYHPAIHGKKNAYHTSLTEVLLIVIDSLMTLYAHYTTLNIRLCTYQWSDSQRSHSGLLSWRHPNVLEMHNPIGADGLDALQ